MKSHGTICCRALGAACTTCVAVRSLGLMAVCACHVFCWAQAAEEALAQKARSAGGAKLLKEEVTEADIAEIISKWTGIPVSKLVEGEREKLLHLPEELHKCVRPCRAACCECACCVQARAD